MLGHNEAISTASISEIDQSLVILTYPFCLDIRAACWLDLGIEAACWLDLEIESAPFMDLMIGADFGGV
jgi:hypothetical protein